MTRPSWVAWLSFTELDKLWSCDQTGWFSVMMVSVCLPSDALSQHLPSYLGFFHLGHGYLFMAAPAKHSRYSLPWMWVCSSQPPPLAPSKDPTCHNQDPELCKYLPLLSSHNFIISFFFFLMSMPFIYLELNLNLEAFLVAQTIKNVSANAGNPDSIPGSGRPLEEKNGNPLQHSCLENPMDRGAWWAMVHGVA